MYVFLCFMYVFLCFKYVYDAFLWRRLETCSSPLYLVYVIHSYLVYVFLCFMYVFLCFMYVFLCFMHVYDAFLERRLQTCSSPCHQFISRVYVIHSYLECMSSIHISCMSFIHVSSVCHPFIFPEMNKSQVFWKGIQDNSYIRQIDKTNACHPFIFRVCIFLFSSRKNKAEEFQHMNASWHTLKWVTWMNASWHTHKWVTWISRGVHMGESYRMNEWWHATKAREIPGKRTKRTRKITQKRFTTFKRPLS